MCRCRLKALPVRFICLPHSLFTLLANNRFHSVLSNPLKSESSSYFGVELQWIFIWAKNKFKLWNECRCASFPRVTKSCCEKKNYFFVVQCSFIQLENCPFFIASNLIDSSLNVFVVPYGWARNRFLFHLQFEHRPTSPTNVIRKRCNFLIVGLSIQPTEMVAWLSSTRN